MKTKFLDTAICFAIGLMIAAAIISFVATWHHVELRRQAQQEQEWH